MKNPKSLINKIIHGSALDELKKFDNECIDMCITSPPYWGLRDYGDTVNAVWDGDENCKHEFEIKYLIDNNPKFPVYKSNQFCPKCGAWCGQLGLEPTFELYTKHLCNIFDEIKRVLKKTGTCWVNIGDTYGGSWGNYGERTGQQRSQNVDKFSRLGATPKDFRPASSNPEIMHKSLCDIPYRFSIEMINRGWIKRNTIIWFKPNCMPSSAKDRFTVDFEYLFFFVKNKKYWFERQFEDNNDTYNGQRGKIINRTKLQSAMQTEGYSDYFGLGRNKRCVWQIPTQPFPDAHFAVFPEALIETPIKAGCPQYICKKCGVAREKVYETETSFHSGSGKSGRKPTGKGAGGIQTESGDYDIRMGPKVSHNFIGYTDCGCNTGFRSGVVLDPFIGSGTTAVVARKLGRDFIGIELQKKYIPMAYKRIMAVPESLFKEAK